MGTFSAMRVVAACTVVLAVGCSAFLRAGHIEATAEGHTLVLPTQEGSSQAGNCFSKDFTPSFTSLKGTDSVRVDVAMRPRTSAAEACWSEECGQLIISTSDDDRLAIPVESADLEGFRAVLPAAELAPYAVDAAVDLELCGQRYRFGGNGLKELLTPNG